MSGSILKIAPCSALPVDSASIASKERDHESTTGPRGPYKIALPIGIAFQQAGGGDNCTFLPGPVTMAIDVLLPHPSRRTVKVAFRCC